jgi:hypothetical protein
VRHCYLLHSIKTSFGTYSGSVQWVPWTPYSEERKPPGRETYNSPPSGAEVKNVQLFTSTIPYVYLTCLRKGATSSPFTIANMAPSSFLFCVYLFYSYTSFFLSLSLLFSALVFFFFYSSFFCPLFSFLFSILHSLFCLLPSPSFILPSPFFSSLLS